MNRASLVAKCLTALRTTRDLPNVIARNQLTRFWNAIDEATQLELATTGLAHIISDLYAKERFYRPRKRKAVDSKLIRKMAREVGKAIDDHASSVLKSISICVGGEMRLLYNFTSSDLLYWSKKANSNTRSWSNRAKWCEVAIAALDSTGVSTLGDLPIKWRRKIASDAERAWRRLPKPGSVRHAA